MVTMTKEDVLSLAKKEDVRFIRMQFYRHARNGEICRFTDFPFRGRYQ